MVFFFFISISVPMFTCCLSKNSRHCAIHNFFLMSTHLRLTETFKWAIEKKNKNNIMCNILYSEYMSERNVFTIFLVLWCFFFLSLFRNQAGFSPVDLIEKSWKKKSKTKWYFIITNLGSHLAPVRSHAIAEQVSGHDVLELVFFGRHVGQPVQQFHVFTPTRVVVLDQNGQMIAAAACGFQVSHETFKVADQLQNGAQQRFVRGLWSVRPEVVHTANGIDQAVRARLDHRQRHRLPTYILRYRRVRAAFAEILQRFVVETLEINNYYLKRKFKKKG